MLSRLTPLLLTLHAVDCLAYAVSALIFRQLFDAASSTYTYLLACSETKEAILIDPVLEQVGCGRHQQAPGNPSPAAAAAAAARQEPWDGGQLFAAAQQ